jgi:hypothetical protein
MKVYPENVIIEFKNNTEKRCRICYETGENESQLLTPCACNGSIAYIHEHCLKTWIKFKNISTSEFVCELCHEKLILKHKYPEETFLINRSYKSILTYLLDLGLSLLFIYIISWILFYFDTINDFATVRFLDIHQEKKLLRSIKNENCVGEDICIFYYISLSIYLIYISFYLVCILLSLCKIHRKCFFFKLIMQPLLLCMCSSSLFVWTYFLYVFYGDLKSIEIFIYVSAFFGLVINWTISVIYAYYNNKVIYLLNTKYNNTQILNVIYNPLARRRRNSYLL